MIGLTRTCQHPVAVHRATTDDSSRHSSLPRSLETSMEVWLDSRLLIQSQPIRLVIPPELPWWQISISLLRFVCASYLERRNPADNTPRTSTDLASLVVWGLSSVYVVQELIKFPHNMAGWNVGNGDLVGVDGPQEWWQPKSLSALRGNISHVIPSLVLHTLLALLITMHSTERSGFFFSTSANFVLVLGSA